MKPVELERPVVGRHRRGEAGRQAARERADARRLGRHAELRDRAVAGQVAGVADCRPSSAADRLHRCGPPAAAARSRAAAAATGGGCGLRRADRVDRFRLGRLRARLRRRRRGRLRASPARRRPRQQHQRGRTSNASAARATPVESCDGGWPGAAHAWAPFYWMNAAQLKEVKPAAQRAIFAALRCRDHFRRPRRALLVVLRATRVAVVVVAVVVAIAVAVGRRLHRRVGQAEGRRRAGRHRAGQALPGDATRRRRRPRRSGGRQQPDHEVEPAATATGGRRADPKGSTIEMQTTEPGAGGSELAMHMTGKTVPGKPEDGSWGVQLGVELRRRQGHALRRVEIRGHRVQGQGGPGVDAPGALQDRRHQHAQGRRHLQGVLEPLRQGSDADEEWKEYRVTFSAAEQEPGWGDPRPTSITPTS